MAELDERGAGADVERAERCSGALEAEQELQSTLEMLHRSEVRNEEDEEGRKSQLASCPSTSSSKMRLLGLSAAVVALLATSTTAHGDHAHNHHEQQHELPLDQALAAANQVRST
jgi:hypothetical protein